MTRQTLVSCLVVGAFGLLGLACKAGGVGDPCIPNQEYSPVYGGADEQGVQIEDRSFQCETRVCLTNHFRGRVSCPFGNPAGGSIWTGDDKECYVPGTKVPVTEPVKPQCQTRKDYVYCSRLCDSDEDCPSDYTCQKVQEILDETIAKPGDKYCVLPGNDARMDSTKCGETEGCDRVSGNCGYSKNEQKF